MLIYRKEMTAFSDCQIFFTKINSFIIPAIDLYANNIYQIVTTHIIFFIFLLFLQMYIHLSYNNNDNKLLIKQISNTNLLR